MRRFLALEQRIVLCFSNCFAMYVWLRWSALLLWKVKFQNRISIELIGQKITLNHLNMIFEWRNSLLTKHKKTLFIMKVYKNSKRKCTQIEELLKNDFIEIRKLNVQHILVSMIIIIHFNVCCCFVFLIFSFSLFDFFYH